MMRERLPHIGTGEEGGGATARIGLIVRHQKQCVQGLPHICKGDEGPKTSVRLTTPPWRSSGQYNNAFLPSKYEKAAKRQQQTIPFTIHYLSIQDQMNSINSNNSGNRKVASG